MSFIVHFEPCMRSRIVGGGAFPTAPVHGALLLLALAIGCGDSPVDDGAPLVVSPAESLIESVSDSIIVTATQAGRRVAGLEVQVTSESRGMPELPVLSAAALSRGVLIAGGPGTATISVRSGSRTASLLVRVEPRGPSIFAASTSSPDEDPPTLLLLGSGLDQLPGEATVRIGNTPAAVISRTTSAIRVLAPAITPSGCTGGAPSATVSVEGAKVVPQLQARLARTGEVRLPVGGWQLLDPGQSGCIRLPAEGGTYVLAYADLREIERSRTAAVLERESPYTVTVTNRSTISGAFAQGMPAASTSARSLHAAHLHADHGYAGSNPTQCAGDEDFTALTFWCRSRPWQVGDRMRIRRPGSSTDTVMATVYRIDDGLLVFAAIDGDTSSDLGNLRLLIDQAMPEVLRHGVPLLRTAFGSRDPVTSVGSGQLLTIIGDGFFGSVGGGCCFGDNGVWSTVLLGSQLNAVYGASPAMMVYLLTHEFVHAWQRQWYYDTRPAEGSGSYFTVWSVEGGADLLALEAVRRYASVPWGANRSLASFQDGAADAPLRMEMAASGNIHAGYTDASSFLRDLVARLVTSGVSLDDALGEVARGSLDDWFGYDQNGGRRVGLVQRMQALTASNWEPGSALLLYTLAHGADDLTSNPALQNPFFQRVGVEPYRTGFGSARLGAGAVTTVHSAQRPSTATGLLQLVDAGNGSSFTTSADHPHVAWAIARIQ
jgi:hypothetical protein